MQAKLTYLPRVEVERRLGRVLDRIPEEFGGHTKLVAHPEGATPLAQVRLPAEGPVLLAVGPEGGFLDREVERLEQAGFQPVSMGERTLRVETACVALMAQVDLLRRQARAG